MTSSYLADGHRRLLTQQDPDELWEPVAASHGLTVTQLRAQVALADQIMEEIIREEMTT